MYPFTSLTHLIIWSSGQIQRCQQDVSVTSFNGWLYEIRATGIGQRSRTKHVHWQCFFAGASEGHEATDWRSRASNDPVCIWWFWLGRASQMIVQSPKTKQQLLRFVQSLKSPKIASVDVLSRDDKASVQKEFDAMLRNGSFSVFFIKDHWQCGTKDH